MRKAGKTRAEVKYVTVFGQLSLLRNEPSYRNDSVLLHLIMIYQYYFMHTRQYNFSLHWEIFN
jgi:hypothetical protein